MIILTNNMKTYDFIYLLYSIFLKIRCTANKQNDFNKMIFWWFLFQDFVAINAPHRHKLSIHILPSSEELNTNTLSPEDNGADLLPVPTNLPKVRDRFVKKMNEFSVISIWLFSFFKTDLAGAVVMKCKSISVFTRGFTYTYMYMVISCSRAWQRTLLTSRGTWGYTLYPSPLSTSGKQNPNYKELDCL